MADQNSNAQAHVMYSAQQPQMMANMMGSNAMQYPSNMLANQQMMYPMMNQQQMAMNQHMMNQMPMQNHQFHQQNMMQPVYGVMHGMNTNFQQQMPAQMMMAQNQTGFGAQPQQQSYRPPPPAYNQQMAHNYQVKQAPAAPAQPAPKPAPSSSGQSRDPRQQQLAATQRRLAEVGRQGHKQLDADSMIQAMFGATDTARKKNDSGPPQPQSNDDDFADFGDFMSMPADTDSNNATSSSTTATTTTTTNAQNDTGVREPTPPPVVKQQDLTTLMMQCSDLTQPAKAKTFQKPSVNEIRPKAVRQTTFQQSDKALRWDGVATDDLHSLFTVPEPTPPGTTAADDLLSSDNDGVPPQMADAPPVAQPSEAPPPHTVAAPAPMPPVAVPNGNLSVVSHIPPLYYNTSAMPPVYLMVLEAVQTGGSIDTAKVYPILLRSQLPREALGHVWSLANKTDPGRLTREELFMVLAMVALVQNNVKFDSAEILKTIAHPPIPNLGQGDMAPAESPAAAPVAGNPEPLMGAPSAPTALTLNHVESHVNNGRKHEVDDFADFQQAQDGFGEFVSSPKDFDADETPTPVNDKFTFPEPVVSGSLAGPPRLPASGHVTPVHHPHRPEHKVQDLHFEFDPCRGSDSSSMSSYAFDTQSRDSDTTKSDDYDDFHAADTYSSASSIGGAPAVAHDARHDPSVMMASTAITSLPPPPGLASDSYSAFSRDAERPATTDLVEDEFGSFKDASVLESKKVIDIKALVNNSNLYNRTEPEMGENKYDVFRTMDAPSRDMVETNDDDDESGWADFASAPEAPKSADHTDTRVEDRSSQDARSNVFSPWRRNVEFTPSSVALGDEPPPLSTDDFDDAEFGHFSSAPPPVDDFEAEVASMSDTTKPPQTTTTTGSSFFKNQAKAHTELTYGAMHDEPPEMDDDFNDFGVDDEEFAHFNGSHGHHHHHHHHLDDLHHNLNNHHQPSSLHFDTDHHFYHTSSNSGQHSQDTASRNSATVNSMFDTEPPPLSPTNPPMSSFVPSQSDHSLESLTAKITTSMFSKEDTNSIASLELPKPREAMADSQSVSSAGSLEYRRPEDKDGQSVQSLDLQSPAEEPVEESFGEFSEAPAASVDDSSSWVQQPKDAKEFLSDGVLLTDRYSAASEEQQQTVEKHAFEWTRCLSSSLDLINDANTTFMDISNASVCSEVVHSLKGNEYIENLIEVYQVTCRISLSITNTAANNDQLAQILKNINLGWNNLQGFIANSPISSDRFGDKFSELRASVLRADDANAQERACGVCLIDVDAPNSHKLFYAGRRYHASCANLWLNCVDSTLPSLRLPELL